MNNFSETLTGFLARFVTENGAAIVSISLILMVMVIGMILFRFLILRYHANKFLQSGQNIKFEDIFDANKSLIPPDKADSVAVLFAKMAYFHSTVYTTKYCPAEIVARFACDDAKKSLDEQFEDRFIRPITNWNALTLPASLFATVGGLIGVVPHINDSDFGALLATKLVTTAIGLFVYALIEFLSIGLKNKYRQLVVDYNDRTKTIVEKFLQASAPRP